MASPIEITAFDNEVTLLYKWANYYRVPTFLIAVDPTGEELEKFLPIPQLIQQSYDEGIPLDEIISTFIDNPDLKTTLTIEQVIVIYYKLWSGQKRSGEEVQKFLDDVNLIVRNSFRDLSDLDSAYQAYVEKFEATLRADQQFLNKILNNQEILSEYEPLNVSDITVTNITNEYHPVWKSGSRPTPEEGIILFDQAQLSPMVPYLQYNSDTQEYYKLWSSDFELDSTLYPNSTTTRYRNVLYLILWTGEDSENPLTPTKQQYTLSTYNLITNTLTVRSTVTETKSIETVVDRLRAVFPNLDFGSGTSTRLGGVFTIDGLQIDIASFLDMMLIQPVMNTYFYVEESNNPFAEKKRLDFHFRAITGQAEEEQETRYIKNSSSVSVSLKQEPDNVVSVNVKSADTEANFQQFLTLFRYLMAYYMEEREPTMEVYHQYLGAIQPTKDLEKARPRSASRRPISILKSRLGNLLPPGYARKCQSEKQPLIIEEADVPTWEANGRQVIKFPLTGPDQLNMVCADESYKYPGIMKKFDLPCCYKTDHINNPNSEYNQYYRKSVQPVTESAPAKHEIRGNAALTFGRTGIVSSAIQKLVSPSNPTAVRRFGVPRSPNSFLHCVAIALGDPQYNQAADKEKYIESLRSHILATCQPQLFKQEFYDLTLQEITDQLADPTVFFDPAKFFRGVEATFRVKVFTFTNTDDTDSLEIPRHNLFHINYFDPSRIPVVIYKNWGSDIDQLEYPQSELILIENGGKFYPPTLDVNPRLYQTLMETQNVYVSDLESGNLVTRINPFSKVPIVNQLTNRGWIPRKQLIDSKGKLRALEFDDVTIGIIPSVPLNIPVVETITVKKLTSEQVIRRLGQPSLKNSDGYWYLIGDIPNAIFVPVVNPVAAVPTGPATPFPTQSVDVVQNYRIYERNADYLMQIMYWLWTLNVTSENLSIEQFQKYYQIDNYPPETIYDFGNLTPFLPSVKTVPEAITFLETAVPTLAENGKLRILRPSLAVAINGKFREWDDLIGPRTEVPRLIKGLYNTPNDFHHQSEVVLLLGTPNFETWIKYHHQDQHQIITKITSSMNSTEPYLYKNSDQKLYLIQNVRSDLPEAALTVAAEWQDHKLNLGPNPPIRDISQPYIVYGITDIGLMVIDNQTEGSTDYLEIIKIGDQYAAMLSII